MVRSPSTKGTVCRRVQRLVGTASPYRSSLPPNAPIRSKRRRFRAQALPAWQTLLSSTATYTVVSAWVVHTVMFAMLIRFETPSGEMCLCSRPGRPTAAEWYRVLREATHSP